ncbi:MAG: lactoylglutathione lyase [Oceanospirillaceae bacterium]|jgi:lactoylglutathione lyase|nr:lactoylglutathione lyase [Oceanospirillaceae bacterium]HCI02447.1 lactoylglutathione lyase [Oceanospirillaceae bacterium]
MRYRHTMIRVTDLEASLDFWCNKLGLEEIRRNDYPSGRFTLVFLAAPEDAEQARAVRAPELELTHNWDPDPEPMDTGRSWGHVAYNVDDIYAVCQRLLDAGITINRPPRDGHMAFVKSPDNVSVELIQANERLEPMEPWLSMPNKGTW